MEWNRLYTKIRKLVLKLSQTERILVDPNTGEAFDMDQYYLRVKSSDEAFKKKVDYSKDNRHFSFADMDNIKTVISKISTVHCGYLLILQCYMSFGTGKIQPTRKDLPKAIGVNERTFMRFWKEMLKHGIVVEKKVLFMLIQTIITGSGQETKEL